MPAAFRRYAERVEWLLRSLCEASRGKLTLLVLDPEPDSGDEHEDSMPPESIAVQDDPEPVRLRVEARMPNTQDTEPAVLSYSGTIAHVTDVDENSGVTGTLATSGSQNTENKVLGTGQKEPADGSTRVNAAPDEAELWGAYSKTLSAHFKKYKFYPEMARKQRLTGTVMLAVDIRRDGVVEDVRVDQTSGSAMLDQAAVQSARRASPVPPFPPDVMASSRRLIIPYRYQLTD